MFRIEGFHGTLGCHVPGILEGGFRSSCRDDEWLGVGTYFFLDGLADPRVAALDWASWIAHSTPRTTPQDHEVAALKVLIEAPNDRVLDLRTPERALDYQLQRRRWLADTFGNPRATSVRPLRKSYDSAFMNAMKTTKGYDVVVAHMHMALTVQERFFRNESRIPNVTVACVSPALHQAASLSVLTTEFRYPTFSFEELTS